MGERNAAKVFPVLHPDEINHLKTPPESRGKERKKEKRIRAKQHFSIERNLKGRYVRCVVYISPVTDFSLRVDRSVGLFGKFNARDLNRSRIHE